MLDYKILNNKHNIEKNGEVYKDLLSTSFKLNLKNDGKLLLVNKWYIARPDLISFACYGDDQYADIICKINGISNPFELNENTILFIPSYDYLTKCYVTDNTDDIITEKNKEFINDNIQNYRKKVSDKRSPNQQVISDSNFVIDKSYGIVFY